VRPADPKTTTDRLGNLIHPTNNLIRLGTSGFGDLLLTGMARKAIRLAARDLEVSKSEPFRVF
jgi:hypothetical protein